MALPVTEEQRERVAQARRSGAPADDIDGQARWWAARAKLLAQRGQADAGG